LFSHNEIDCLRKYSELDCEFMRRVSASFALLKHGMIDTARYLLVRLALRKADKWHRLGELKYYSELGDSIPAAIDVLCEDPSKVDPVVKVEEPHDPDVIDLTLDEDDEPETSQRSQEPLDLLVFAEDESKMTLHELLICLSTDELKAVAKERRLKTVQNVCSFSCAFIYRVAHILWDPRSVPL
jgi:hypothetical protein